MTSDLIEVRESCLHGHTHLQSGMYKTWDFYNVAAFGSLIKYKFTNQALYKLTSYVCNLYGETVRGENENRNQCKSCPVTLGMYVSGVTWQNESSSYLGGVGSGEG